MRQFLKHTLFMASSLVLFAPSISISAVAVPDQVSPGRISSDLGGSRLPSATGGGGAGSQAAEQGGLLPKEAHALHFKLKKIVVKGNTRFSETELLGNFQKNYGKQVTLLQLEQLVLGITKHYREQGYVLSQAIIPPQTISGGVFTIQVIEGFVSQVNIQGNISHSAHRIVQAYVNDLLLANREPLQVTVLERVLLLLNDTPGLTVKSVLQPSKTQGAADIVLVVEEKMTRIDASWDNRGTRFVGPLRFTGGVSISTPILMGSETIGKTATTVSNKGLTYSEIHQSFGLGTSGAKLNFDFNNTLVQPQFTLAAANVRGSAQTLSLGIMYPIQRTRRSNLFADVTVNYLDNLVTVLGTQLYYDRVRSIDGSLAWNFFDSHAGYNDLSAKVRQGFNAWGVDSTTAISRTGATPSFTKMMVTASREQQLWPRWSLTARAKSQYAFERMYSSEAFGFGGADFGGAYDASEIVGDHGVAGRLQLNYHTTQQTLAQPLFINNTYYVYYDAGLVWNKPTIGTAAFTASGISTGLGVNLNFSKYTNLSFEMARALTRPVASELTANGNGKRWRGFFTLNVSV